MDTVRESVIFGWLLALWKIFDRLWDKSLVHQLTSGFVEKCSESSLSGFFRRFGRVEGDLPKSYALKAVDGAINLIPNGAQWVYRKKPGLWDGSFVCRILSFLAENIYLPTGLFFLLMLVAPHNYWNNLYAFLGVTALLGLSMLGCARSGKKLEMGIAGAWYLLFVLFIAASFVTSSSVSSSVRFLFFHFTGIFMVVLMTNFIKSSRQLTFILGMILIGVSVASLYACVQGCMGVEVNASYVDLLVNPDMPGRVYSVYDNPNNFAEILVLTIPFFFAMMGNAKKGKAFLLNLAVLGVAVIAIGLTYSRSSWIGLMVAALVFAACKNKRVIPLLIIFGILVIPVLPKSILNRLLTIFNTSDTSTNTRFQIFYTIWQMIKDNWLLGTGLGTDVTGLMIKPYNHFYSGLQVLHSHNIYFQIWTEMGIFALIAFLGALVRNVGKGIHRSKAGETDHLQNIIIAGIAALCGIMIVATAEYIWYYPRVMFMFWAVFAITVTAIRLKGSEKGGLRS